MKYLASEISHILGVPLRGKDRDISRISIDSRKIRQASSTIFIGISGNVTDGHKYVSDAYKKGVRSFLVSQNIELPDDAGIIVVDDTVAALQHWASHHRSCFDIPVVAITGSNGKTIVKEWLAKLASSKYQIVKSPRSYNSQIGVPLSVLQMNEDHTLAIFEAGISQPHEMSILNKIIQPTIGVFTILGDAHAEGFTSRQHKLEEKAKLFTDCKTIIYNKSQSEVDLYLRSKFSENVLVPFDFVEDRESIEISCCSEKYQISVPFGDRASKSNIATCLCVLKLLKVEVSQQNIQGLQAVDMRSEIIKGKWNSTIINDAYTADIQSISNIVDLVQIKGIQKPLIILSDLDDNDEDDKLYPTIVETLQLIDYQLITVGISSSIMSKLLQEKHIAHFKDTQELGDFLNQELVRDQTIILKGARRFRFETIAERLSLNAHNAYLEISISAIEHNLSVYASMVKSDTKIMAVMKASAYGSGINLLADSIANKRIDYMAVANIEEGILLRKSGITLPIMIFSTDYTRLDIITEYRLEPVIYAPYQFDLLADIPRELNIHIKLDTGMNRLGFKADGIDELISKLKANKHLKVASIFSHLSNSDDKKSKAITVAQQKGYIAAYDRIESAINEKPIRHICNTHGIGNEAADEMDMVRLGIGLYGIDNREEIRQKLIKAHSLIGRVVQIKNVKKGESIGYSGSPIERDKTIAIVNIGYADGIPRMAGHGNHKVLIRDHYLPTVGNICMDLSMIDISDQAYVSINDKVEFFGSNVSIESLASNCNTIPYEILTGISSRIKKMYTTHS